MGHKVNPVGLRLGINRTWDSRWFAGDDYSQLLHEDLKLRGHLRKKLHGAGVSRVVIERPAKKPRVTIYAARPGVVIGKKGQDIEVLKRDLSKMANADVALNIVEIRKPEIDATLVADKPRHKVELARAHTQVRDDRLRLGVGKCAGMIGFAHLRSALSCPSGLPVAGVAGERARGRKLAELVAHHVLVHLHRQELVAVVDAEGQADELRPSPPPSG